VFVNPQITLIIGFIYLVLGISLTVLIWTLYGQWVLQSAVAEQGGGYAAAPQAAAKTAKAAQKARYENPKKGKR
jgi:hypothetical protein